MSYHIFGVKPFLMATLLEPNAVKRALRKLIEVTVAFGNAQIDAGADALTLATIAPRTCALRTLTAISFRNSTTNSTNGFTAQSFSTSAATRLIAWRTFATLDSNASTSTQKCRPSKRELWRARSFR